MAAPRERSRARGLLGLALLAVALAGCETSDREYDRGDRRGSGSDPLGGVLGDIFGGGGGASRGGGGDVLGGVLGGMLGQRVTYRCEGRRGFSTAFEGLGPGVSVEAEGVTYRLRAREAGEGGTRFGRREYVGEDEDGNDVRLAVDGDSAELLIEGSGREEDLEFRDCRAAQRPAARR